MKKLLSTAFLMVSGAMLFAQDGPKDARNQGAFWQTLIMIAIAIVFFYFILWRPEQKRRKAMEQKRSSMKKGDRITAMGIVGTLDRIKDQTVVIKNVDGSKIEILKAAITEVGPAVEGEKEPQEASS
jgi:preprotein translocase subunit YajC